MNNEIVHTTDILPTLARIAGASVPSDRIIDGVNRTGIKFSVAFQMRQDPVNQKIRELVQQRVVGNYSASPVYADERIYFLSEEGVATVIAPEKEYRLLATNSLDAYTLASMALSDSSILIRSHSHLYRISTQ